MTRLLDRRRQRKAQRDFETWVNEVETAVLACVPKFPPCPRPLPPAGSDASPRVLVHALVGALQAMRNDPTACWDQFAQAEEFLP